MLHIYYNICHHCLRIQSPTIKRKLNGTFIRLPNGILHADYTFICNKCIYTVNEIKKELLKTSINNITCLLPNELVNMILDLVNSY